MQTPIIISGFGASTMRGWRPGLANHETFRALFERALVEIGISAVITDAAQPGNTVLGGQQRFERDILLEKPDAVMIDFGVNDSSPRSGTPSRNRVGLETYREVHEFWFDALSRAGIPFLLLTPQKLATSDALERNQRLLPYVETLRALSAEHHIPLVDTYAAMEAVEAGGSELADFYSDGMHFNAQGSRFVADLLLTFEKADGFFRKVSATRNQKISV